MTRLPLVRLAAALLVGGALTVAVGGAAQGSDPHDIPLTVEVTDSSTSTSPAGSSSPAGSTSTGSAPTTKNGRPGSAVDSSAAVVTGTGTVPTTGQSLPAGAETVGGVLAIGGISTSYAPSVNPLVGTLHVQMTIQNLSSEVIAPTVGFWLTNGVGMRLSQQDVRGIGAIAPGELRVAEADLTGVGQWTAVDVHMKLTPPAKIGGVEIEPFTRDRWVLAPPWFVVVVLVVAAGVVAAWRWSARVPATRVAVGAAS